MKHFWYILLAMAGILIAVYSVFYDPMLEPTVFTVEGHDVLNGWQPPEDWNGLVDGGIDIRELRETTEF